jgi:hypothetical protein
MESLDPIIAIGSDCVVDEHFRWKSKDHMQVGASRQKSLGE